MLLVEAGSGVDRDTESMSPPRKKQKLRLLSDDDSYDDHALDSGLEVQTTLHKRGLCELSGAMINVDEGTVSDFATGNELVG